MDYRKYNIICNKLNSQQSLLMEKVNASFQLLINVASHVLEVQYTGLNVAAR